MKIIDRATRGTAARFIWGGLVVVFLIGLFLVRGQEVTALNEQVQSAEARVESYAKTTIADQAIADTRAGTITFDKKDFAIAVEGDIFTDPTIARVRIWDKDGLLLGSSDPSEMVGRESLDLAAPECRELVRTRILESYEEPYEAVGLRKDGTTFQGEIHSKAIRFQFSL